MNFNGARVLIVRDAAIGDAIQVTPAIRWYAQHGAKVYVACKPPVGEAVYEGNPHVARLVPLEAQESIDARAKAIKRLAEQHKCQIVRDAAFSCEGRFLFGSNHPAYEGWPLEVRRANAHGKSYYEQINHRALKADGCDLRPELFPQRHEERRFTQMRAENLGAPIVLLQLQGSSLNKCYPFWPQVVNGLQASHSRLIVITTGDVMGTILETQILECGADRSRLWPMCAAKRWSLRDSLIATKYVDCVCGPETGILNAAACFDTPKVPMLSHSSVDNLCRGWVNCHPIQSPAPCSPCYRLVAGQDRCEEATDDLWSLPPPRPLLCMASIPPDLVVATILEAIRAHQER